MNIKSVRMTPSIGIVEYDSYTDAISDIVDIATFDLRELGSLIDEEFANTLIPELPKGIYNEFNPLPVASGKDLYYIAKMGDVEVRIPIADFNELEPIGDIEYNASIIITLEQLRGRRCVFSTEPSRHTRKSLLAILGIASVVNERVYHNLNLPREITDIISSKYDNKENMDKVVSMLGSKLDRLILFLNNSNYNLYTGSLKGFDFRLLKHLDIRILDWYKAQFIAKAEHESDMGFS